MQIDSKIQLCFRLKKKKVRGIFFLFLATLNIYRYISDYYHWQSKISVYPEAMTEFTEFLPCYIWKSVSKNRQRKAPWALDRVIFTSSKGLENSWSTRTVEHLVYLLTRGAFLLPLAALEKVNTALRERLQETEITCQIKKS